MTINEKIMSLIEKRPELAHRKNRYILIEAITGIDPDTSKLILSIERMYRQHTVKDSVGEAKEREWHKPKQAWAFDNETKQAYLKI